MKYFFKCKLRTIALEGSLKIFHPLSIVAKLDCSKIVHKIFAYQKSCKRWSPIHADIFEAVYNQKKIKIELFTLGFRKNQREVTGKGPL